MKKVISILAAALVALAVFTSVAYYNTSSLGYDDANIISVTGDGIRIMYFNIDYKTVKDFYESIKKLLPDNFITI